MGEQTIFGKPTMSLRIQDTLYLGQRMSSVALQLLHYVYVSTAALVTLERRGF